METQNHLAGSVKLIRQYKYLQRMVGSMYARADINSWASFFAIARLGVCVSLFQWRRFVSLGA